MRSEIWRRSLIIPDFYKHWLSQKLTKCKWKTFEKMLDPKMKRHFTQNRKKD